MRFPLQRFGTRRQNAVQCLDLEILNTSWYNWLGCWNVYNPSQLPPTTNTSALLWKSLGNFLLSWCSHTGFEEFCSRKGSKKNRFYILPIFYIKNNVFSLEPVQILFWYPWLLYTNIALNEIIMEWLDSYNSFSCLYVMDIQYSVLEWDPSYVLLLSGENLISPQIEIIGSDIQYSSSHQNLYRNDAWFKIKSNPIKIKTN